MLNGVFGRDGTPLSRDGVRLLADEPIVISRGSRWPTHERDDFFPDDEEECRRNEVARRRDRDHRRANHRE